MPMRLFHINQPFDHPDFLYDPKIDGFLAPRRPVNSLVQ